MILADGWHQYSIWQHSTGVRDLYRRRCLNQVEEMTCHSQAVDLLMPHVCNRDILLDVGCGSGYFYHSLRKRQVPVDYYGIDAEASFVAIGKECLPKFGLDPSHLIELRIEDLNAKVDHVICVNVLSNIDNYHRPLERMLYSATKTLILRESIGEKSNYQYVVDRFLDEGIHLKVHVNTYDKDELITFINSYGFKVEVYIDEYTGGKPQDVIGYPHHWTFLRAIRNKF
ncbi:MAG: class I SAM-dependent methyltransferase [Cyanobacteria bacterium LVE1205-1]|jgi:ubiquinone/menaquinone biosynthesis C-methylase UbiE